MSTIGRATRGLTGDSIGNFETVLLRMARMPCGGARGAHVMLADAGFVALAGYSAYERLQAVKSRLIRHTPSKL
jgi:hypothetical protein